MILPMENTEKMIFPGEGKFHIPIIKPETDIRIDKLEWIPFNYALSAKDRGGKGIHFYCDDYHSLNVFGAILTSMCRFCNSSVLFFPLIFPCSETTRKRCRFGAPINGTGWQRTGKCTVSRSFPQSNGCGRKATSGALTESRETPSSPFRPLGL